MPASLRTRTAPWTRILPPCLLALAFAATPSVAGAETGSAEATITPKEGRETEDTSAGGTVGRRFAALEDRLLAEPGLSFGFDIRAEGAVSAHLEGHLVVGRDHTVQLVAEGDFGGRKVEVEMHGDGKRLRGNNGGKAFDIETPPALAESLVVGLTRMGLLHNLARLVGGQHPDHAEGGVRDWVTLDAFRAENPQGPLRGLSFDLQVGGQPSGRATLWTMDPNGWPKERQQTVQFPEGKMEVQESYVFLMQGSADGPKS